MEQGLYLVGLHCRENWTQKQLADKVQVGQTQVSRMERGLQPISKEIAKAYVALLKVPYRHFLTINRHS